MKEKQKYDALRFGQAWPDDLDEQPADIDSRPMLFSGFTELTAKQQSFVGGHPAGEASALSRLIDDIAEDAEKEGVWWTEVSTSLTSSKAKWLSLCHDLDRVHARHPGIRLAFVCCISRGDPPKQVEQELTELIRLCKEDSDLLKARLGERIVALGLVGNETIDSFATKFESCFRMAREQMGWQPVPHAGEMTGKDGPASVSSAIQVGARRVGHGFLAMRDAALVEQMKQCQLCCEVCPISNRHLCDKTECMSLAEHPLPDMLAAGIPCCINADDPGTFGSRTAHGLVREFAACRDLVGLTDEQLALCAKHSFTFSFCPEDMKKSAHEQIEAWLARKR